MILAQKSEQKQKETEHERGRHCRTAWDTADREGKAFVEGLGHQILPLADDEKAKWVEAVKPILDEYVNASKEKGLPGEEFLRDLQAMIKAPAA